MCALTQKGVQKDTPALVSRSSGQIAILQPSWKLTEGFNSTIQGNQDLLPLGFSPDSPMSTQMPSGHRKKGILLFGCSSLKRNPPPKKKRTPQKKQLNITINQKNTQTHIIIKQQRHHWKEEGGIHRATGSTSASHHPWNFTLPRPGPGFGPRRPCRGGGSPGPRRTRTRSSAPPPSGLATEKKEHRPPHLGPPVERLE